MMTRRMSSQAATLSATEGEPRVSPVPSSVHDALADPQWRRAMEEEYAAVLANQTWDLVPRPSGCNVVTGKWIWTHKRRADGATRLAGFSGVSSSGLVWIMMRPSVQW